MDTHASEKTTSRPDVGERPVVAAATRRTSILDTLLTRLGGWLFRDPEASLSLIRRLLGDTFRTYAPRYAVAFVFMGLLAISTAASAWIMKDVVNQIFIDRNPAMVVVIAFAIMVIFIVKGASTYGSTIVLSRVGNAIVAEKQRKLYARVQQHGMAFFDHASIGDIATRLSHNAQSARAVLDLIVTSLGRDLLSIVSLTTVMVIQDPGLSLIAFLIMPPAVYGVSRLIRRVRKIAKAEFLSLAKIVSVVQETVQGARVVKAFNAEEALREQMSAAIAGVETRANKIASLTARTSPLMETLGGFAIAAIVLYGGFSVIYRGQDPGAFFSFITAVLLAYEPAKRLARLHVTLEANLIGVRLMYQLLDKPVLLFDAPDAKPLNVKGGTIVFDDVDFRYGDKPALNGLTLTVQGGRMSALVGPSGAGKTTIFSLIERFYDVQKGAVAIDGQDVRHVTQASLREHIAFVSQETFLFDATVGQNIALGCSGATQDEIIEAARNAHAHDFIMELPQGYDTMVGEGGGRLSGGQRQRIAIARAMLRDAPILLLDEATSSLDAESEHSVQMALARLMKGRTTLVIAHRLATVRDADCILVIDRGRLSESGSHIELLQSDGMYRRLYDLQFREQEEAEKASERVLRRRASMG